MAGLWAAPLYKNPTRFVDKWLMVGYNLLTIQESEHMYKPSLYARLFYNVETLKLLEMLYRDSTEISKAKSGGFSYTYTINVYADDGSPSVDIRFYTDSWLMVTEFYGIEQPDVYSKCPTVFYHHVSELYSKLRKAVDRRIELERKAQLSAALAKVDLSAKRLTVDKA